MGTKQEMGASLEELEKAGLVELPAIADAFSGASTALSGISTSGMFIDSGPFSANCPQVPFDDLVDAMVASTRRSGSVLDDVSEALVATARDFARTDEAIRAAFVAAGGTLR